MGADGGEGVMGQQGHRGTRPAPTWAGSTWSMENSAATTRTRQLLGAQGCWPSRGRAAGHRRWCKGLGTLALGEP